VVLGATLTFHNGGYLKENHGEVVEWAALHQNELIEQWENMRAGRALGKIGGLK
jgi:hypothetical protein